MSNKVRFRYAKQGLLRFLSHLEMIKLLERAIKRAGLKLEYSQGFTPRPKLTYGTASSVGVASNAEYIDMVFRDEINIVEVMKKLNAVLPKEIRIIGAMALPINSKAVTAITVASDYELTCKGAKATEIMSAIMRMRDQAGYIISRQKENSVKHVEVGPMVVAADAKDCEDDSTLLFLRVKDSPAGSIKPVEVIEACNRYFDLDIEVVRTVKTEVLSRHNGDTVPVLEI